MSGTIRLQGNFNYTAYRYFLSQFDESSNDPVKIDLSDITGVYPNGIAPFGARLDSLKRSGREVAIVYPTSHFAKGLLDKFGFISVIEHGISITPPRTAGRVPLAQYSSGEELNQIVDSALASVASSAELPRGVLDTLEWTLNELADNVLVHAGDDVSGWICLVHIRSRDELEVAVVDCGRGILHSLREGFPGLKSDQEALELAIQKGITRDRTIGQGNGLAGTLKLASAAGGYVNIHSGRGSLRQFPDYPIHGEDSPHHQGTFVSFSLPVLAEIDVTTALWGHEVLPALGTKYWADEGIRFNLREESVGFGNRATGRALRNKLNNLMRQFPDSGVTIDFKDVDVISASFADEFIAKIVKDTGITKFFGKVRLVGVSRFTQTTIDNVIQQRMSVDE